MLRLKDLLKVISDDEKIVIIDVDKNINTSEAFRGYAEYAKTSSIGEKTVIEIGALEEYIHIFVKDMKEE